ncbi:hypothetical protein BDZ45DRAFT_749905 [Acephala macrosclerotiorum]|nr:hypothetical protein BDZ45DRAFT_749905 [Acephala macrosclerotiorum]
MGSGNQTWLPRCAVEAHSGRNAGRTHITQPSNKSLGLNQIPRHQTLMLEALTLTIVSSHSDPRRRCEARGHGFDAVPLNLGFLRSPVRYSHVTSSRPTIYQIQAIIFPLHNGAWEGHGASHTLRLYLCEAEVLSLAIITQAPTNGSLHHHNHADLTNADNRFQRPTSFQRPVYLIEIQSESRSTRFPK